MAQEITTRSSQRPRIAMIGAGMGGLICSSRLIERGLDVQCFDKGARPGGRAATRISKGVLQFDHGAQYFTCRDPRFQAWVDSTSLTGHIAVWDGKIVAIDEPAQVRELEATTRYVGVPRMNVIAECLAKEGRIQFETKVGQVEPQGDEYLLKSDDGIGLGLFDIVLWNCPPIQVAACLPVECQWANRLQQVTMLPCWAVMVAQTSRWDVALDGAFLNQGILSWVARDSSKPGRDAGRDHWVLHSSTDWASENLEAEPSEVIAKLVAEAERMLGRPMPPGWTGISHRWLYSRPQTPLVDDALWDAEHGLGACGDWCGEARVEGAFLSGLSLANRVLASLGIAP